MADAGGCVGVPGVGWSGLRFAVHFERSACCRGIHKIKHVVVIMQENRSFDSYFGTYPGADGIASQNGRFTVCLPNPATKSCEAAFHDSADASGGADHTSGAATADVNGGKMDGFVARAESSPTFCGVIQDPACAHSDNLDVMGYHDAREIPNYWTDAQDFVLNDHLCGPVASWSLPAHLYMVSAWSPSCTSSAPSSCSNNIVGPYTPAQQRFVNQAIATGTAPVSDAWTDITNRLHKDHVSWGYYVEAGTSPIARMGRPHVLRKRRATKRRVSGIRCPVH